MFMQSLVFPALSHVSCIMDDPGNILLNMVCIFTYMAKPPWA